MDGIVILSIDVFLKDSISLSLESGDIITVLRFFKPSKQQYLVEDGITIVSKLASLQDNLKYSICEFGLKIIVLRRVQPSKLQSKWMIDDGIVNVSIAVKENGSIMSQISEFGENSTVFKFRHSLNASVLIEETFAGIQMLSRPEYSNAHFCMI